MCGAPWSHLIGQVTGIRKARQMAQQQARRTCGTWYGTAEEKAQRSARVPPGTFDLSLLERLKATVGWCTICELDTADYLRATAPFLSKATIPEVGDQHGT